VSADPADVVRAFADRIWNDGDFGAGTALFGPTFRHHDLVTQNDTDLDGFFDSIRNQRRAFPGVRFQIEDAVTDGERVATRWRVSGVHAERGRTVAVDGMSIDLVADGRIVENWTVWDRHGLLEQLGRE
jgi:predicted ester cyclase